MIFIGIDPGKSGGIAAVDDKGRRIMASKMPSDEVGILTLLEKIRLLDQYGEARAALERVSAMPGQGVSSTFAFGAGYGGLRMALAASQIPYDTVTPAKWQRALSCLSRGDKNVTKRRASELWPALPVTHAIADALLLAEYCRRSQLKG